LEKDLFLIMLVVVIYCPAIIVLLLIWFLFIYYVYILEYGRYYFLIRKCSWQKCIIVSLGSEKPTKGLTEAGYTSSPKGILVILLSASGSLDTRKSILVILLSPSGSLVKHCRLDSEFCGTRLYIYLLAVLYFIAVGGVFLIWEYYYCGPVAGIFILFRYIYQCVSVLDLFEVCFNKYSFL